MANESFYGDGPMARALSDWLPREPSASVLVHVWAVAAVITATAWMIATVVIGARALRDSMTPTKGARRGAAPGNSHLRDGTGPEYYGAAAPATTPPPVSRLLPGGWCAAAAAPRPQAPVATDPTAPSEATQGCGTQPRAKFAASAHFDEAGAGGVGGGAPAPGGGPPAFCYMVASDGPQTDGGEFAPKTVEGKFVGALAQKPSVACVRGRIDTGDWASESEGDESEAVYRSRVDNWPGGMNVALHPETEAARFQYGHEKIENGKNLEGVAPWQRGESSIPGLGDVLPGQNVAVPPETDAPRFQYGRADSERVMNREATAPWAEPSIPGRDLSEFSVTADQAPGVRTWRQRYQARRVPAHRSIEEFRQADRAAREEPHDLLCHERTVAGVYQDSGWHDPVDESCLETPPRSEWAADDPPALPPRRARPTTEPESRVRPTPLAERMAGSYVVHAPLEALADGARDRAAWKEALWEQTRHLTALLTDVLSSAMRRSPALSAEQGSQPLAVAMADARRSAGRRRPAGSDANAPADAAAGGSDGGPDDAPAPSAETAAPGAADPELRDEDEELRQMMQAHAASNERRQRRLASEIQRGAEAAARGGTDRPPSRACDGSEDDETYPRPRGRRARTAKAITDLKGIEMGMKADAYLAVKSDLRNALDMNMSMCDWTEEECLAHTIRHLPRALKATATRIRTVERLFRFLDQQFLPLTTDQEEESWDTLAIGDKTVPAFYTELEVLADRLDKTEPEMRKAFIKGMKADYPEMWRKLRTDHSDATLTVLVREATKWLELTRADKEPPLTGRRRLTGQVSTGGSEQDVRVADHWVAAAYPSVGNDVSRPAEPVASEMRAMRHEMCEMSRAFKEATKELGVRVGEQARSGWRDHDRRPVTNGLGKVTPNEMVEGKVVHVNGRGYARLEPKGPPGQEHAHVLRDSASEEERMKLQVGQPVKYRVQRDGKGLRVTELEVVTM